MFIFAVSASVWLELQYSQRPLEGSVQYKQHQLRFYAIQDILRGGVGYFLDGEKCI